MENRKQLAERLGINPKILGMKLSVMKFEPTERRIEEGKSVHYYNEEAAAEIQKLLKPEGEDHA